MKLFFDALMRFMESGTVWVYLFIFFGKIAEVAVSTLRSMLINRGERMKGVAAAILEYTLWIFVTASAITNFQRDPLKVVVLIAAFAFGNFLGSWLEEKLAFGLCTVSVITMDAAKAHELASALRSNGHAVTSMNAEGMDDQSREVLSLTVRRKFVNDLLRTIRSIDERAMITVANTASVRGGFLKDTVRRHHGLPSFLVRRHVAVPPVEPPEEEPAEETEKL